MADTREILLKLIGRETVSGAAKKAAAGLDDMGDSLDDAAKDSKKLDRALLDNQKSIDGVLKALARDPGDSGLRKQLRALDRESREITKIRSRFADLGDDSAAGFGARFVARIGPVLAHAPIGPALAIPVAAAAPALAAILSSALAGAVGGSVVGAGIALSIQDPQVKAAATRLGLTIKSTLTDAAAPFRDETLDAIQDVRNEVQEMGPDLREIFAEAAPLTRKFGAGLTGFIRESLPGIKSLTQESHGFADVWQRRIPKFGETVADQFEIIAGGADESAEVLEEFFAALELGVSTIGPSIRILSETAGALNDIGALTGGFLPLIQKLTGTRDAADQATPEINETVGALDKLGEEAVGASREIKTLQDVMREWEAANRSAVSSEIAFEEAIDDATAAAKENGKTVDTNTAKGRANMQALNALAGAAVEHAQAIRESSGNQEQANQAMQRGYDKFVAAAAAMDMAEGEADRLARSLGLIPPGKTITIRYPTLTRATIQARALAAGINSIDTYKEITIVQRLVSKGVRISGITGRGGVTERASGGPVSPGRTFLVGEEGPELVEFSSSGKVHSAGETRKLMTSSGGGTARVVLDVTGADEDLKRLIRKMVRVDGGGNVQVAFGR